MCPWSRSSASSADGDAAPARRRRVGQAGVAAAVDHSPPADHDAVAPPRDADARDLCDAPRLWRPAPTGAPRLAASHRRRRTTPRRRRLGAVDDLGVCLGPRLGGDVLGAALARRRRRSARAASRRYDAEADGDGGGTSTARAPRRRINGVRALLCGAAPPSRAPSRRGGCKERRSRSSSWRCGVRARRRGAACRVAVRGDRARVSPRATGALPSTRARTPTRARTGSRCSFAGSRRRAELAPSLARRQRGVRGASAALARLHSTLGRGPPFARARSRCVPSEAQRALRTAMRRWRPRRDSRSTRLRAGRCRALRSCGATERRAAGGGAAAAAPPTRPRSTAAASGALRPSSRRCRRRRRLAPPHEPRRRRWRAAAGRGRAAARLPCGTGTSSSASWCAARRSRRCCTPASRCRALDPLAAYGAARLPRAPSP